MKTFVFSETSLLLQENISEKRQKYHRVSFIIPGFTMKNIKDSEVYPHFKAPLLFYFEMFSHPFESSSGIFKD